MHSQHMSTAVGLVAVGACVTVGIAAQPLGVAAWYGLGAVCGVVAGLVLGRTFATRRRRVEDARHAAVVDELLPNTAHELRTPLTVVMASIGMIRDGLADDADEHDALLTQASAACHLLAFLINDLVDDAAIRAGRLRLDLGESRVAALIGDAVELLEPVAAARGIGLQVQLPDTDPLVRVDAHRLQQVLFNLVGNALKFAPDASRVLMRAAVVDDHVRIEVRDEGAGVPAAQQVTLFDRFHRGTESSPRRERGNGLGLHLCRRLVECMGGRIGYRDADDGPGAVFWFELDVVAPQPAITADA